MEKYTLQSAKILIVEDERDINLDMQRCLHSFGDISYENIEIAENLNEAESLIPDFQPNIVLLDVKIPEKKGEDMDSRNSKKVIDFIENYNYRHKEKIKTIVISGTVDDEGIREWLTQDPRKVFKFFDKNRFSSDQESFMNELLTTMQKALDCDLLYTSARIEFAEVRKHGLQNLQSYDEGLFNEINSSVIKKFEEINEDNENENSEAIIIKVGKIINELTYKFGLSFDDISGGTKEPPVKYRLMKLSGRKFQGYDQPREILSFKPLITRKACEYATLAFEFRNNVEHTTDPLNDNIYFSNIPEINGHKYERTDAVIVISLMIPLINDYISYLQSNMNKG